MTHMRMRDVAAAIHTLRWNADSARRGRNALASLSHRYSAAGWRTWRDIGGNIGSARQCMATATRRQFEARGSAALVQLFLWAVEWPALKLRQKQTMMQVRVRKVLRTYFEWRALLQRETMRRASMAAGIKGYQTHQSKDKLDNWRVTVAQMLHQQRIYRRTIEQMRNADIICALEKWQWRCEVILEGKAARDRADEYQASHTSVVSLRSWRTQTSSAQALLGKEEQAAVRMRKYRLERGYEEFVEYMSIFVAQHRMAMRVAKRMLLRHVQGLFEVWRDTCEESRRLRRSEHEAVQFWFDLHLGNAVNWLGGASKAVGQKNTKASDHSPAGVLNTPHVRGSFP